MKLKDLADMERLPHVLPLLGAYEDFEHVHLVYEGLSATAVCLTDKVYKGILLYFHQL